MSITNEIITSDMIKVCTWAYEGRLAGNAWEFDEITDGFTSEQSALLDAWNNLDETPVGPSRVGRKASGVEDQLAALIGTEYYEKCLAYWINTEHEEILAMMKST